MTITSHRDSDPVKPADLATRRALHEILRHNCPTGFMKEAEFSEKIKMPQSVAQKALLLAASDPSGLNYLDIDGRSALHWAARYVNPELIGGFLALGADPLIGSGRDRFIPLQEAAQYIHGKALVMLTQASGGAETALYNGRTALLEAAFSNNALGVADLLAFGANPAAVDEEGNNAIHMVCFGRKNVDIALIILMALHRAGAPLNHVNAQGKRPIDVARFYASPLFSPLESLLEADELSQGLGNAKSASTAPLSL